MGVPAFDMAVWPLAGFDAVGWTRRAQPHMFPNMETWESEIRECETAACRAFLAVDIPALERLWADAYLVNSPLMRVLTRKEVLGALAAGRITHGVYEFEIEHMARHGDVVVVMGHDHVTNPPSERIVHRRFTNVWQLESGTWRSIARHANALVDPPGGIPANAR